MSEPVESPLVTSGRYVHEAKGIYDTRGGFYIADDLWAKYMAEGRSDRSDHGFVLLERVHEDGIADEWARCRAVCARCREERLVWRNVDVDDLNHGWCVPDPFVAAVWTLQATLLAELDRLLGPLMRWLSRKLS